MLKIGHDHMEELYSSLFRYWTGVMEVTAATHFAPLLLNGAWLAAGPCRRLSHLIAVGRVGGCLRTFLRIPRRSCCSRTRWFCLSHSWYQWSSTATVRARLAVRTRGLRCVCTGYGWPWACGCVRPGARPCDVTGVKSGPPWVKGLCEEREGGEGGELAVKKSPAGESGCSARVPRCSRRSGRRWL